MEKKNEMFNRLNEETRRDCIESKYLYVDIRRTHDILAGYDIPDNIKDEYKISVLSPKVEIQHDDEKLNQLLPGSAGEWTDDEDSYVILYKFIEEKNLHSCYDIEISRYSDIDNILYNKITDIENIGELNCPTYFLSDKEDIEDIEKIRKNLSLAVERVL